ncbi:MAG: DNA primase [Turicibacter sp.]|nr:DNA primase [Turicibacter sp.]
MFYPQETIEDIRSGNSIVDVIGGYVVLKNRGGSFFGLCPFHNEKTPSFSVSQEKQMYYCFGCGASGNVISFIMAIENYDFVDSLKFLAEKIHYTLPTFNQSKEVKETAKKQAKLRTTLLDIHSCAARFFYETLTNDTEEAKLCQKYLDERNVSLKLRRKLGLGLASNNWDALLKTLQKNGFDRQDMVESGLIQLSKNSTCYDRFRGRLMFPIIDINGNIVAFAGRDIFADSNAKYLNSPETPIFNKGSQLYGIQIARKARKSEIIIVEGYMDVIALYQAGFTNTVAVMGTALSSKHTQLLKRINASSVILLFDRDNAGVNATLRAIPTLLEAGLNVKCLQVPKDVKDPDEYITKYGASKFSNLLENAKNHALFRIDLLLEQYDLKKPEELILFTQSSAKVLATIANPIEANVYIQETAKLTGIAVEAIISEVKKNGSNFLQSPKIPVNLSRKLQNTEKTTSGLFNAYKGLLSIMFAYPHVAQKMKNYLKPEELYGLILPRLLTLAYNSEKKQEIANIISHFETLEEQEEAARILIDAPNYANDEILEHKLNDMYRVIKRNLCETKITNNPNDIAEVNIQGFAISRLKNEHIKLFD